MIRLINGEAIETLKKLINDGIKVDAVITDIPYGTTNNKWDNIIPFVEMWKLLNQIKKDDSTPIVIFGSEPFSSRLRVSNIENFKFDFVWEKQKAANFMQAKYQPLKYHEMISVFGGNKKINYFSQKYKIIELSDILNYNKKEMFNFMNTKQYDKFGKVDRRKNINNQSTNKNHLGNKIRRIRNADDGYRNPKSILKINKSINKNIHPTQKPVELMEFLIKSFSLENDTILDFTMGSASTALAAINTNRNFIGIELNKKCYNSAVLRTKAHTEDKWINTKYFENKEKICQD